MKRLVVAFALFAVAFGTMGAGNGHAQTIQINGQPVPLNHVSAEACKDCHEAIYNQWKGSMHANSTASGDPIHNAFYRQVIGDPTKEGVRKGGKFPICLQCHVPNAAIDESTKTDAMPAYSEGVNCTVCHRLSSFKGVHAENGKLRLGLQAYELADTLRGPSGFLADEQATAAADDPLAALDEGGGNPHLAPANGAYMPLEGNPRLYRTSDSCMGCHDQRNNSNGVPLCQTGNEYAAGESKTVCQTCHMSVTDGVADHSMGGGHSLAMLKRSMVVDVTATRNGDGTVAAEVYLENLQPHAMPTGAPFRNIHVEVSARDAAGNVVWRNAKGHPAGEDAKAYMHLVLLDDEGKPTTPPVATEAGPDNRLKPYEVRTLSYAVPAEAVSVRAEVYYSLLWPMLQKRMAGKIPDELVTPQRFMFAEAKL